MFLIDTAQSISSYDKIPDSQQQEQYYEAAISGAKTDNRTSSALVSRKDTESQHPDALLENFEIRARML